MAETAANDICFEKIIGKLNKITTNSINRKNYQKALASLSASAKLKYIYNQCYKDDIAEHQLLTISTQTNACWSHSKDDKTVLFYDGFGLDTRGLAGIYLKALSSLNYRIVYVTAAEEKNKQPRIFQILSEASHIVYFIPHHTNYVEQIELYRKIFQTEHFSAAFFYSKPWDVSGVLAFNELQGKCRRYQINLTDHAFWLGLNAFDYCIEFREYGARISHWYRGIDKEALLELPYYPIIGDVSFQGFDFDTSGKKIIFSGGALYKTLDQAQTYYKLVEHIVKKHDDVIFVYAGKGNTTYLQGLIRKYPQKIYHITERTDLYQVLRHTYLYLNTYPISGALMLQYAAAAGCVPVTLKRPWDDDVSGILLNEEALGEVFSDFQSVCDELDRLITEESYISEKRKVLSSMLISEESFSETLSKIITTPVSPYIGSLPGINTDMFREHYKRNVTDRDLVDALAVRENSCLWNNFPILFLKKAINKVCHKYL